MGSLKRQPSTQLVTPRLRRELYHLSKATLFELVIDYSREWSGHADTCDDDEVIAEIKRRGDILANYRE